MHRKNVSKPLETEPSGCGKNSRLPLILSKSNLDRPTILASSNKKFNQCVLFDKGLGHFNSVQINGGKTKGGRYL